MGRRPAAIACNVAWDGKVCELVAGGWEGARDLGKQAGKHFIISNH